MISQDFYNHSELALAAYANFSSGTIGTSFFDALIKVGMTPSQATEFVSEWKVVAQYDGAIEVEFGQLLSFSIPTGLSVTLFENSDGQQVVAIRGTEAWDPLDPLDIVTDVVDIAVLGSSQYQLQYESLSDKIEEWLDNGTLQSGFTVTGHSLGGFLATNPRRSSIADCGYSPFSISRIRSAGIRLTLFCPE